MKYNPPKQRVDPEFGVVRVNRAYWDGVGQIEIPIVRYDGKVAYVESAVVESYQKPLWDPSSRSVYLWKVADHEAVLKGKLHLTDLRDEVEAALDLVRDVNDAFKEGDIEFEEAYHKRHGMILTPRQQLIEGFARTLDMVAGLTFEDMLEQVKRFNEIYVPIPVVPPMNQNSVYFQFTTGCPKNPPCTYCPLYGDRDFSYKSLEEAQKHIEDIVEFLGLSWNYMVDKTRKGFIGDGNALAIPQSHLFRLLDYMGERFNFSEKVDERPRLRGLSLFAHGRTASRKPPEFFRGLKARHVDEIYIGIESGSDNLLEFVKKGCSTREIVRAFQNVKAGGIKAYGIIMIGLGEREFAEEHRAETGSLISRLPLDHLFLSNRIAFEGTRYARDVEEGRLTMMSDVELLQQRETIDRGSLGPLQVYPYDVL